MSRILKGRVTAYDNIAVGSATGWEKTIAGVSPSDNLPGIGYDRMRTVSGGATSWHTSRVQDNLKLATSPSEPSNAVYQHTAEDVISTS